MLHTTPHFKRLTDMIKVLELSTVAAIEKISCHSQNMEWPPPSKDLTGGQNDFGIILFNNVHTRCIVKTSGFTRGVCKKR